MQSTSKPLLLLLFLSFLGLESQNLQFVNSSHSFTRTTELGEDSVRIELMNSSADGIRVKRIHFQQVFGTQAYSASSSSFTIGAQQTALLNLYFHPSQNIAYSLPIVFETDSFYGCLVYEADGQGAFSNTYYNSTENLSSTALFNALKTRITAPYVSLSYNGARDEMYSDIDNSGGQVTCVYTGRVATFNSRSGANSNSFNTEHTWPQSLFNSASPMKSDIHHLFPTDVTSNSQRGSLPFGMVTGSPSWQQGGSKMGGGKFEPRDLQKGTVARAMMYFVLRYQNYSNFFDGNQETTLLGWHDDFPPSAKDRARNNDIEQLQANRNPFTDYPQFSERLGLLSQNGSLGADKSWELMPDTIIMKQGTTANAVMYNSGNQSLNVNNIQLADTNFQYTFNGSMSLAAGEYRTVSIELKHNVLTQSELSLQTNSNVQVAGSVYLKSVLQNGIGIAEYASKKPTLFPNPSKAGGQIQWDGEQFEFEIFDVHGREIYASEELHTHSVLLPSLKPGIYTVFIQSVSGKLSIEKWVLY